MQKKQQVITPKKIKIDTSVSEFPSDAAFSLRNMKVIVSGDSLSTLSISTEKGNTKSLDILGTILGLQVLGNSVIIFSRYETSISIKPSSASPSISPSMPYIKDYIIKATLIDGKFNMDILYEGNLNFSKDNPIESLGIEETVDIQKVFWVDGKNQLRFINISDKAIRNNLIKKNDDGQFNIVKAIIQDRAYNPIDITITKNPTGGNFPAGITQYFFNYSDTYGASSNIIKSSPLFYNTNILTSSDGKQYNIGVSPEGKSPNSYTINIRDAVSSSWKFLNIYRMSRTSLDSTPDINLVAQLPLVNSESSESYTNEIHMLSTDNIKLEYDFSISNNTDKILDLFSEETLEGVGFIEELLVDGWEQSLREIAVIHGTKDSKYLKVTSVENNKTTNYEVTFGEITSDTDDYFIALIPRNHKPLESLTLGDISGIMVFWSDEETSITYQNLNNPIKYSTTTVNEVTFVDTGSSIASADLSSIMDKALKIPYTLAQKDGILFIGNVKRSEESLSLTNNMKDYIKSNSSLGYISSNEPIIEDSTSLLNSQYIFNSALTKPNNEITYFKFGNTYRFGVQFMSRYGEWSDVCYLGDYKNDTIRLIPTSYNDGIKSRPLMSADINVTQLRDTNVVAARLVCVYPNESEREVLCQGIALNTMYNLGDRLDNVPYSIADWFSRPTMHDWFNYEVYSSNTSIQLGRRRNQLGFMLEYRDVGINNTYPYNKNWIFNTSNNFIEIPSGQWTVYTTPHRTHLNSEIQYSLFDLGNSHFNDYMLTSKINSEASRKLIGTYTQYKCNYSIDRNTISLYSPELQDSYTSSIIDRYRNSLPVDYKFRVIGYAPLKNTISDFQLKVDSGFGSGVFYGEYQVKIEDKSTSNYISPLSRISYPNWCDIMATSNTSTAPEVTEKKIYSADWWNGNTEYDYPIYIAASFPLYPWQKKGSVNNCSSSVGKSVLDYKWLTNFRICLPTRYIDTPLMYNPSSIGISNDIDENSFTNVYGENKLLQYKGNVLKLLTPVYNKWYQGIPDNNNIFIMTSLHASAATGKTNSNDRSVITGVPKDVITRGLPSSYTIGVISTMYDVSTPYISVKYDGQQGIYNGIPAFQNNDTNNYTPGCGLLPMTEPIQISYKSTTHLVFNLGKWYNNAHNLLPTFNVMSNRVVSNNILSIPENKRNTPDIYFKISSENTTNTRLNYTSVNTRSEGNYYIPKGALAVNVATSPNLKFEISPTDTSLKVAHVYMYLSSDYPINDSEYIWGDNITYIRGEMYMGSSGEQKLGNTLRMMLPYDFRDTYDNYTSESDKISTLLTQCIVITPERIGEYSNFKVVFKPLYKGNSVNLYISRIDVELINSSTNNRELRTFRFCEGVTSSTGTNDLDPMVLGGDLVDSYYVYGTNCGCSENAIISGFDRVFEGNEQQCKLEKNHWLYANKYYSADTSKNLIYQSPNENFNGFYEPCIHIDDISMESHTTNLGYYVIGEIYRDTPNNIFGGTSEAALTNNIWTPCSDVIYFNPNNVDTINILGNQGDTYYMRYDCLKTSPRKVLDDDNEISDVVSFMCETYVNLDARYDKLRGNFDNMTLTQDTMNLYNKVYSQKNNIHTGVYLNSDYYFSDSYPSQIYWSKQKTFGEIMDSWTIFSDTNVFDLDGDKGPINKLLTYSNEIFAFQDKGISRIIYNPRVQIPTNDNTPIELSTSGRVEGKVYISNTNGCVNKWALVAIPEGIVFMDDLKKDIVLLGRDGNFNNISNTKGVYSWLDKNSSGKVWNLNNNEDTIRIFFDEVNGEIYFTSGKESLVYNTVINEFTSIYSPNEIVNWMFNLGSDTYQSISYLTQDGLSFKPRSSVWKSYSNPLYSTYFNVRQPYSLEVIANEYFMSDKIFENIEFTTNGTEIFGYENTTKYEMPFTQLKVTNEYQNNLPDESYINNSALKKKFRVWRWNIGRNGGKILKGDRIRGNWCKIKMTGNSQKEVKLYSIGVDYYV